MRSRVAGIAGSATGVLYSPVMHSGDSLVDDFNGEFGLWF